MPTRLTALLSAALALIIGAAGSSTVNAAPPKVVVGDLSNNPRGVAVGTDGRIYLSIAGAPGKAGDGAVVVVVDGKATPFAAGLDDPSGIVSFQNFLIVADGNRVVRIARDGKITPLTPPGAVPYPFQIRDLTADESGIVYASADGGDEGGALFRIDAKGTVSVVLGKDKSPKPPTALVSESVGSVLVSLPGKDLFSVRISDGEWRKMQGSLEADSLAYDRFGRLYGCDAQGGTVWGMPRPGVRPVKLPVEGRADRLALSADGKELLLLDTAKGTLSAVSAVIPGWEVDDSPLPLETAVAFPDLKWAGWEPVSEDGKVTPLRPIVLTHAGDSTNRVFVATQHGVVHVFPNDPNAKATKVYLDIRDRVFYDDKENEQGLLGMTFHPNYKKNGELYVFYTKKDKKYTNVLSRFKVTKDPDKADAATEEVLFSIDRPFWNHDGGTVAFGPDGMLYLVLGDGGAANDPFNHAQNLGSLLGKVLRLDVSKKADGKGYAIPADNPFVKTPGARPEIWCLGLRNVWRMAFDRKTGDLWAADVGQNLWEEVNILKAGGNYGWNKREALHPFGPLGGPAEEMIDPIWEYHHDIGKSVTGGVVYRGKSLPELDGHYLMADYVSSKMWAVKYDTDKKRVVANRPIKDRSVPVMSFGEDEQGEAYFMSWTPTGQGLYRFAKAK